MPIPARLRLSHWLLVSSACPLTSSLPMATISAFMKLSDEPRPVSPLSIARAGPAISLHPTRRPRHFQEAREAEIAGNATCWPTHDSSVMIFDGRRTTERGELRRGTTASLHLTFRRSSL